MTIRSKGAGAGFGWLKRGISVGYRYPKPIFGGAALLAVACLFPSLITLALEFTLLKTGANPGLPTIMAIMAVSMLCGLLLVPLYAGYLRVIDAADRGLPVRAFELFDIYRQGGAWRIFGYGLAMLFVYVVLLAMVLAAMGGTIVSWYTEMLIAQTNHLPPPQALPAGFGKTMALFLLIGLVMLSFYAISLGQVALRQRNILHALGDGLIGTLKNLLPLIVFAASATFALIGLAIALALLVGLLIFLGRLVSIWLAIVLVIPLYIAFVLMMFTAIFGAMYYLWRDVCGADALPGLDRSIVA